MRLKPFVIAAALSGILTLPASAYALGLGKLTVNSGLGQPLSAQIELTAAQRDDLDSLRARIADPSVYRDNGAQYLGAFSRARITVEQAANATYLRVTTQAPVNEPFLNLIIELSWATGRVVRDYTFLLDPPGATEMQAIEPATPIRPEAAEPSRMARPPSRRAGNTTAPASSASNPPDAAGGYTVKRGDTLSKIANEYKPPNVSLEQMLVALFRSNENAFDGKNMNRLRSGQIITVPQGDQIASMPQSEAVSEVKVQASDWRAYRDRLASGAPSTDSTAPRQSAGGKITAAVEDQAAASMGGKDRVSVSREAGAGSAAARAEELAAKDKALREANSRVADLEKTVRDLQRAAALKSGTMSDLQAKAEAGKAVEVPKASDTQVATAPTPAATMPPAATPPATPAVTPPAPTAVAPAVVAPAPAPEAKAPETKAPDTTPAPETKATTPAPEPKAVPKVAPKKAPEPSFIDDLFGNTPTWAVGGGALIVLGGIAAHHRGAPAQDDEVRGQHHFRDRHQDQYGLWLDRRRGREHR